METEQIIRLMEAVSRFSLSEFEYQQGDVKLSMKGGSPVVLAEAPAVSLPPAAERKAEGNTAADEESWVKSPLIGTFYSAPSEGAAPFVQAGDTVKKGQVIGIIETMKLMNEIESDRDGVIAEIAIENEQVVEFGQRLFRIEQR